MKEGDPTGYKLLGATLGAAGGLVAFAQVPWHSFIKTGEIFTSLIALAIVVCVCLPITIGLGALAGASIFGAIFKVTDPNRERDEPPPK